MIKRRYDFRSGRLIPRKKYGMPFRLVGIGIIVMIVALAVSLYMILGKETVIDIIGKLVKDMAH